jgi:GT2 family glycosyltransferase
MTEFDPSDISVAIATRDRPEMLARVLDTLAQSDHRPGEIVIVDQSGDDRSERVARRPLSLDVPVRYFRHDGSGLGVAQNCAFTQARCPIIAVTDDDCVPASGWLTVVASSFESDPKLGAVTGPVLPLDDPDPRLVPVSSRTSMLAQTFSGRHAPWKVGSGNNFAIRREWIDAVRGNDERLGPGSLGLGGVDMDLFYRLLRAGARIRYDPNCLVYHTRATAKQRLGRRAPYGHGVGAAVAIWLREGDVYALWVLVEWLALRLRRAARGILGWNWALVHEESLVLAGTVRGLLFGVRVPGQRPSSYVPPLPKRPRRGRGSPT